MCRGGDLVFGVYLYHAGEERRAALARREQRLEVDRVHLRRARI